MSISLREPAPKASMARVRSSDALTAFASTTAPLQNATLGRSDSVQVVGEDCSSDLASSGCTVPSAAVFISASPAPCDRR